jgi:hypothetical protein
MVIPLNVAVAKSRTAAWTARTSAAACCGHAANLHLRGYRKFRDEPSDAAKRLDGL